MQFRLRPTLLTATATLVVTTMAVTGLLLQHYLGQMVERLVIRQFDIVAGGAAIQIETLFEDAVGVLQEERGRAELGLLPLGQPDQLGRDFAERLRQEPNFAWISHGDLAHDRFVGAARQPDGSILVSIAAADVDNGVPNERIALPDGGWRPASLPPGQPYSVIDQAWFKAALGAEGVVVSDPYEFAEGRAGISLTLRHTDPAGRPQGVLTVDFLLDDLSRGLAKLTEEDRNDAVLLDPGGLVLASAGVLRAPDLTDVATAVYAENRPAIEALAPGGRLLLDADWQGTPYRVAFQKVAPRLGGAVVLAVFEPLGVLLAPMRQLELYVLAITLGAMVLGLLGAVLLATHIAHPLRVLAAGAQRIRAFDLDRPIGASSWITEVATLARAMEAMRVGVRSFGHYVPIGLVRRLLEAGGGPTLGGERRELSLLFSDIIGFTHQTEHVPPEQVMQRISAYFQVMTEAIEAHQGVIDKFIGDAVMALWNAPAADPLHAQHACRAALACQAVHQELNDARRADGLPPLATRFGLHTGDVVVGNLGSEARMQYTALGANVNLAARIVDLNKHYGTAILVSEATRAQAGEGFVFRFVARAQPVGTSHPVVLHELLGATDDATADELAQRSARWAEALVPLDAGDLDEALRHFEAITAPWPDDGLAAYYSRRVAARIAGSADTPWDGIDRFDQK